MTHFERKKGVGGASFSRSHRALNHNPTLNHNPGRAGRTSQSLGVPSGAASSSPAIPAFLSFAPSRLCVESGPGKMGKNGTKIDSHKIEPFRHNHLRRPPLSLSHFHFSQRRLSESRFRRPGPRSRPSTLAARHLSSLVLGVWNPGVFSGRTRIVSLIN
jgi:hypothetical protein